MKMVASGVLWCPSTVNITTEGMPTRPDHINELQEAVHVMVDMRHTTPQANHNAMIVNDN